MLLSERIFITSVDSNPVPFSTDYNLGNTKKFEMEGSVNTDSGFYNEGIICLAK